MYFFLIRFCIAFFLRFLRFLFLDSLSASLGLATDCSEMTLLYFSTCLLQQQLGDQRKSSEGGSPKSEVRSLKSEVRSPKSEVRSPKS